MASKVLLQTVPKPSHRRWGPLQMVFSNTSTFGNCKLCSPTPSAARTISINERHYHRWHHLSHHRLRRPPPSISPLLCPPMRTFHISSIISSTPESFHGISLPKGKQTNHPEIENVGVVDGVKVQEAEVVKSDHEKEKTRQMIAEYTRAELWSHSVCSDEKSKDADDVDFLAKNGGSVNNEDNFLSMSPYERRVFLLKKEEEILASQYGKGLSAASTVEEVMGYSQRSMNIAELHYQLGQMEQSQEFFMDALTQLLELDQTNTDDSISFHIHFATAKIMHSLGAIHARCGEYSEAFRWYDESMKRKRDIFGVVSDPPTAENCEISSKYCSSASEGYHFELGMTYNGLAALEIMKANGNSPDWQKAMRLFKQAEKNYIYHYYNSSSKDTTIISSLGSDAIRKMQPHHAQALINVRSNMGELLLQQDDIDNALNQIRSALELAKEDVENMLDEEEKGSIYIPSIHEPSPAERKNAVVDLQLKIADCLSYKEDYDLAAEAYERALHLHIGFRRWNRSTESTKKYLNQLSDLPVSTPTNVEVDISNTTSLEAALRNSLADCLAHIGQPDLSLKHYEASLAIKRRIGGDHHNEVAHTLMSMGALLGSSGDTSGALNCFKEALYIYRTNLEEESGVHREKAVGGEEVTFYGEEHESVNQLQGYVQNAMKNIAVIESALMKNSAGQK